VTTQQISPCNLSRLFSAQVRTFRLNFQMSVLTLFLQDIYSPASGSRYLLLQLCPPHEQSLIHAGKVFLCTLTAHLVQREQFPSRLKNIALFSKTGQGDQWGQERGKSAVGLSWHGCLRWLYEAPKQRLRCTSLGKFMQIPVPFGNKKG